METTINIQELTEKLAKMTIRDIALLCAVNWKQTSKTGVYFGARPYLDAMYTLNSVNDKYGMDSGKSIVLYFLSNATTWKGEVAKAVKKELNKRVK